MDSLREDYSISARELDTLLSVTPQGMHHLIKSMEIETQLKKNKKYINPSEVRRLLQSRGYEYKKEVIAFSVVKGGVGKTSLSHSFAIRASQYGAKVLVIDIDQQANLTQAFGIDEDNIPTIFEVIQNEIVLEDSILNITNNLHLIPSSMNMSFLDRYLQLNHENLAAVLKDRTDKALSELGYDYIIFDCPPAISSVTAAATLASDRIVMPVTPMKFSLQGLKASFEELANLENKFKKKNLLKNIILNRFDARKTSSNEYLKGLAGDSSYNPFMMNCFIRENSELENCINQRHSVFDYGKKNNAREDLDLFTKEIMGLNESVFAQ